MFSLKFIITLLFQIHVLSVSAGIIRRLDEPSITLPLARRVNFTSVHDFITHDRSRAKALRSRLQKYTKSATDLAASDILITNQVVTYVANVGIGNPPQYYSLIIDTGSSNTWAGARSLNLYDLIMSKVTGNTVSVQYGSGYFEGLEYLDTVTFSPNVTLTSQSLGGAVVSSGFNSVDGILGLGPTNLTNGTLFPDITTLIPTVTDNLYTEGMITRRQVALYFQPINSESAENGEMTFGGVDTSKNTSDFTFIPVTSTSPASNYWGVDQVITYGDGVPILDATAGIVDTGTTLIYFATDAYNRYAQATGATLDNNTGLLALPSNQYSNLKSLFFKLAGTIFELTANAQIWPRPLNTLIGGTSDKIYLVISDIGSISGQGLDFINGYTFLERFYSVYDSDNKQVGLATTAFTFSEDN